MNFSVAVVMPALGEADNLRVLLPQLGQVLDSDHRISSREIFVVLPLGPGKEEREEIERLGATPVVRSPSDSFGDAIRSGLRSVPNAVDLIITLDADGSHDPQTIPRLLDAMQPGVDVVVASRYTEGGRSDNSLLLKLMSRTLNWAYAVILRIQCNDISTNFKIYRADQVRRIALTCNDFDVLEELLFRIREYKRESFKLVEVPDHFRERQSGVTKRRLGPFTASYLLTLLRLRLESRSGSLRN